MKSIATKKSDERKRIGRILYLLKQSYPNARIVLKHNNPWELLVAVVLSAQCTDITVNKVTEKLFAKYKSSEDYVRVDTQEFEYDIKPTGFYRSKAKNILASAKIIKEKYGGRVPDTMEALTALPGIGRKSANIILGNAYEKIDGIAVDTHVSRLSQRLRLVDLDRIGGKRERTFKMNERNIVDFKRDADPVKIERELMAIIPKSEWFRLTYTIIDHGRAVCKARTPDCAVCMLRDLCPSSRVSKKSV